MLSSSTRKKLVSFSSSLIGVFAGTGISQLILYFLNTAWNDIVRTDSIQFYFSISALSYGFMGNVILCAVIIYFILRKQFNKQVNEITRKQSDENLLQSTRRKLGIVTAISACLFILLMIYNFTLDDYQNSSIFFLGGFLMLAGIISAFGLYFIQLRKRPLQPITLTGLALRNLGFNFKRNILIAAILAIGVFIVLSTGANRVDFTRNADNNSSGTGGFSLYVETNLPVHIDLQSPEGMEELGISAEISQPDFVQMLQFRNDDASCLNLNKIIRPTVLGVKPELLSNRNSFFFVKQLKDAPDAWKSLDMQMAKNCVPAVADQTVITWGARQIRWRQH